jgi:hypothetical protein
MQNFETENQDIFIIASCQFHLVFMQRLKKAAWHFSKKKKKTNLHTKMNGMVIFNFSRTSFRLS